MIAKSIQILNGLRHSNGLFSASALSVKTGYNLAWIRDNVYEALGLEVVNPEEAARTYHALLDILLKHEYKIDWAIRQKPQHAYQYIHARYDPQTMSEIWEEWGNKQNDAIGALLFKIGDLQGKGFKVIRGEADRRIIQKLVHYLQSIQYWHDKDNGIWEESEEVHASSIGACVAGLKKISNIVSVPQWLIDEGQEALNKLLPRESATKEVDLALLSLIYPFNVVTEKQREAILKNVEQKLVRQRGVIRYVGDAYYSNGQEAEWCFGFPWLATIHKQTGNSAKHKLYLQKTLSIMTENGELPELYFGGTEQYNENTPLGWGQALYLNALW